MAVPTKDPIIHQLLHLKIDVSEAHLSTIFDLAYLWILTKAFGNYLRLPSIERIPPGHKRSRVCKSFNYTLTPISKNH